MAAVVYFTLVRVKTYICKSTYVQILKLTNISVEIEEKNIHVRN